MTASYNPTEHSGGQFSPLKSLLRSALREAGENSPDVYLANAQPKLVAYANKVLDDVNTHPYMLDLIRQQFAPFRGAMAAGSSILTVNGTASTLGDMTPVCVEGAGDGAGNLYTFILQLPNVENSQAGTYNLADAAETAVLDAIVRSPYTARQPRYKAITDIRPIDDRVMIEGVKAYLSADVNLQVMQAKLGLYYQALNTWMASVSNLFGELEVVPREIA